ncbi:unnamed protein product [Peniophora sp. CBMAI 1063]|nr:unnamed protein product [Peniophora sp. CBMAI 1063]
MSFLSNAGNTVTNAGSSVGKGVGDAGSAVGKGVGDAGSTVGKGVGDAGKGGVGAVGDGVQGVGKGVSDGGNAAFKGISDGGNAAFKGVTDAGTAVGGGIGDAGSKGYKVATAAVGSGFENGFQLAANISKTGLDLQKNVVGSVGAIGGTAIDGVVTAVTMTTGAVFDPISNTLKSIEGLEGLGEGLDKINGLSTVALRAVADTTKKAIKLGTRPPTLFDPDADGVVNFDDTQKGFVLLGLPEKQARIAAYALHTTFTYSTADSWLSLPGKQMLVQIDNIHKTRWGRNWGSYERVDWVSDTDVETFFGMRERETYAEYWKDIKSYYGTALLIFEWGTTWPFAVPNLGSLDLSSPVVSQLGTIMRTVILPTIAKSHQHAREVAQEEGKEVETKSRMPSPPPQGKESDSSKTA